jgi:dihydrofolate synthase/folylpolyglutamate synthase
MYGVRAARSCVRLENDPMRGLEVEREQAFFRLFATYYDLEKNTARRYAPGEYTLARMQPLAEAAGHPERHLKVLHVAGTKGKGSTCHFAAALLKAAGRRCGLFASPHLVTVRERFLLDGELVGYDQLLRQAEAWEAVLRARGTVPTLFEVMTLLALRLFVAEGCEYAVLETGIGGRLDATNYVPSPLACAITPVSFDHTELLGETIEAIAAEKAGIIKPGVPVVLAAQPYAAAAEVVRQRAKLLGAPLLAPADEGETVPFDRSGTLVPFLRQNLGVALALCRAAGVPECPEQFRLPELRARCEVICQSPLVVLDAAHNADSARRLVEALHQRWPQVRWTVVLGVVKGKDSAGIVRELAALGALFVLTDPHTPRASDLPALEAAVRQAGLPAETIARLDSRDPLRGHHALLFTGSFFTALIGEKLFAP